MLRRNPGQGQLLLISRWYYADEKDRRARPDLFGPAGPFPKEWGDLARKQPDQKTKPGISGRGKRGPRVFLTEYLHQGYDDNLNFKVQYSGLRL